MRARTQRSRASPARRADSRKTGLTRDYGTILLQIRADHAVVVGPRRPICIIALAAQRGLGRHEGIAVLDMASWPGRRRKRRSQCSRFKVWPPPLTTRAAIGGNSAMSVSASCTRIELDWLS